MRQHPGLDEFFAGIGKWLKKCSVNTVNSINTSAVNWLHAEINLPILRIFCGE